MDTNRDKYLNRRSTHWLTYRSLTLCVSDWARNLNINPKTLDARINKYNFNIKRALTTPVRGKRYVHEND